MTVDGIDLLAVAAAFLILLAAEHTWRWHQRIEERRMRRLVQRNLFTAGLRK